MNQDRFSSATSPADPDQSPPLPTSCLAADCPCRSQIRELRQQVGYWRAIHHNAVARCHDAQQEIEQLRAQLRLRERQLLERKSEKRCTPSPTTPAPITPPPKRPRGQQRGRPSPPRRCQDHLPAVEEIRDIPADQQHCPRCGQPGLAFPGTEDAALVEIDVRAYRRVYRRKRYRPHVYLRKPAGHHHGTATAEGPSQESSGYLGRGDGVARQIPLRPADASAAGGSAQSWA